jgi:alkanesulfonate monooxygenase SsuD/methylene tetrahydromethanopterin reductase-like flavin-dependent oxidoreductase (luciferase family)
MAELSFFHATQPNSPTPLVAAATAVRAAGLRRLWIGQSLALESFGVLSYVAAKVPGVGFGTAVALTPLQHPALAATSLRTVAALSGQPVAGAFGVSEPRVIGALGLEPYDRPGTAAGDFAAAVRAMVGGGRMEDSASYPGASFSLPPLDGIRPGQIEVGLGVLRRGMARAVGRGADFGVTWLTPPAWTRDELAPAAAEAARKAGVEPPRMRAVVHAAVTEDPAEAATVLEQGAGAHLRLPHYRAMIEQSLGVPTDAPAGDAVRALLQAGAVVHGTPQGIGEALRAHAAASGVDELLINPFVPRGGPRLDRLLTDVAAGFHAAA